MSYDYMLIKAEEPICSLSEFDHEKLVDFDDWEMVKEAITAVLPDTIWNECDGSIYGTSDSVPGRFEIMISSEILLKRDGKSYGFFSVFGSFRADQAEIVSRIAEATDFTAIDMQKDICLYKQKSFA